jgi:hypothetical protein
VGHHTTEDDPLPDFIIYIFAVIVAIAAVIGGLIALIYLAGKATNALSKTRDDPKFGKMRYFAGLWSFDRKIATTPGVSINLPGKKTGPDPKAVSLLAMVEDDWPTIEAQFLERFAAEIIDQIGDGMGEDLLTLAHEQDKAALRQFTELSAISVEQSADGKEFRVWVDFLHNWDPEHTGSLVLDEDGEVVDYGMTVGM